VTRILGIDPGSRITGWGVVDVAGQRTALVAAGTLRIAADGDLAQRLKAIHDGVRALCAEHHPQEVAVERAFVSDNADTALKLGQARAAAICGTFDAGVAFFEYAPAKIKQAIVGSGAATKQQVQHMVRALLPGAGPMALDASDALAVALCHAHGRGLNAKYAAVLGQMRRKRVRRAR
jgi:crossover junction endodeoxyribonuclease RuvC